MNVLGLLICGIIILFAGKKLSFYGDLIAEKTGIGKAMIGFLLMSTVTSLPELMVGISSTAFIGSANLAVGDVLGSCVFNLLILSIMDSVSTRNRSMLGQLSQSHILAASFGIILFAMVGLGLYMDQDYVILPFIGLNSLIFAVIFFVAIKILLSYNQSHPNKDSVIHTSMEISLSQTILRFSGFALIIIAAAFFLPHFAEGLANQTGLSKTFVGTLILAASTSLPEIAVSVAAVRMGSTDMAVGNILGSNIFNIFILFIDDLFYTKGALLKDASDTNLISVFSIIVMSAIVIIAITFRKETKRFLIGLDTFLILLIYIVTIILLYFFQN